MIAQKFSGSRFTFLGFSNRHIPTRFAPPLTTGPEFHISGFECGNGAAAGVGCEDEARTPGDPLAPSVAIGLSMTFAGSI
jgi:hypothetical protein